MKLIDQKYFWDQKIDVTNTSVKLIDIKSQKKDY